MGQIKEFIQYLFNALKFWIIVQPWETGLRVRLGKNIKRLDSGIYFRIPYFDAVYTQEKRLRVASMPIQTLTTKDLKTITLNAAIGYSISDVEKLYNTLYHPETTLINMAMSSMGDLVFKSSLEDIDPDSIEQHVLEAFRDKEYGLTFEYFKVTNFAAVRTYRLIQDTSWVDEGLDMSQLK